MRYMRHPRTRSLTGRSASILAVGVLLALGPLLAACGGSVTNLSTPPTTDESVALTVQRSPDGPILATGGGATLYDFGPDTPTHSACLNDGCVYQWPPYIVIGTVRVGPGVNRSLVGTVRRPGGAEQLSYNGHPLYTYIRDVEPGMVTGQAIDQDGGPWYVLTPAGTAIHTAFTVNGS
jgi:predicted lipoprotein with Yx(FWY)xxD motif